MRKRSGFVALSVRERLRDIGELLKSFQIRLKAEVGLKLAAQRLSDTLAGTVSASCWFLLVH